MKEHFILNITLGNSAMTNREEIADALHTTAAKVRGGQREGTIMDLNGNTVGNYQFIEEEDWDLRATR